MTSANWSEAERLWRSGAAMDEKLAMVERALAAFGGGRKDTDLEAADSRGAGRKK
jgi:hypothetical protein